MVAKHRELTEKYKALRLQPDALFLSRFVQTFFNKFTKKGKKSLARRHLRQALKIFRMGYRRPVMYHAILRIFRRLRTQFLLISARKGRKIVNVPVPVRRNKRDVLNLQTLYEAMTRRRERQLFERISQELLALTFKTRLSTTMRARSALMSKVHDERVNMEARFR